jgi:hypothetical protein
MFLKLYEFNVLVEHKTIFHLANLLLVLYISGCSNLLPKEKAVTVGVWDTYEEAQSTFDKITPHHTTLDELSKLNINAEKNSNVTILTYADITSRFIAGFAIDGYEIDSGVKECILAKTNCKGYEINESALRSKRYGNFWADLLNFKRKTDIRGWRFNGIILINDQVVIYKLSSGQPAIHEKIEKNNPLGPLQSGGIALDVLKKEL